MAALVVVSLLALVNSGELDIASLFLTKDQKTALKETDPATIAKEARKAKPPPMLPPAETPAAIPARTENADSPRFTPLPLDPGRELRQSFARMDGKRAAAIIKEMDDATRLEVLASLKERDLARILEWAEPADAAGWSAELLAYVKNRAEAEAAAMAAIADAVPADGTAEPDTAEAGDGTPEPDDTEEAPADGAAESDDTSTAADEGAEGTEAADNAAPAEETPTADNATDATDGEDPGAADAAGGEAAPTEGNSTADNSADDTAAAGEAPADAGPDGEVPGANASTRVSEIPPASINIA
jgi:hypothetical protein